jgi:hypothetical protein
VRDWATIRERYLRDGLPIRLGGLAANLGRIQSFAAGGASDAVVESLMDESKYFIEWTAAEAEVNIAAELVELQVELAGWQLRWRRTRDAVLREQVVDQAGVWSDRVLEMSGLLG